MDIVSFVIGLTYVTKAIFLICHHLHVRAFRCAAAAPHVVAAQSADSG